jgi:zona occludens toxin
MITLTSGLPGAGKTLLTIADVEALRKKENREVYYHGIKELTLPWKVLEDPLKWYECPPGSIIVIDEAQYHFPLRGNGQAAPEHVARTATHRHHGFDLFLITQHPGKLDAALRKDIEVHRHIMRKFGSRTVTVHQWQGVRENCDKTRKDSVSTTRRYPKEVFGWYKSAEVHTHKLKIPPKILLAVAFMVCVGVAWFIFLGRLGSGEAFGGGKPAAKPGLSAAAPGAGAPQAQGQQANKVKTVAEYVAEQTPRIPGLEHTAPVYDGLTAPKVVPVPAACIQWTGKGCKCFTQQGTPYKTSDEICVQIVRNGIFLPFEASPAAAVATPVKTSAPAS